MQHGEQQRGEHDQPAHHLPAEPDDAGRGGGVDADERRLQRVGGGAWGGCVYDVDRIIATLKAGERALKE